MNEQELNKKLAEWAGMSLMAVDFGFPSSEVMYEPPNFTESLDACFQWLVPNLYKQDYYYELIQWNSGQHKAIINKKTVEWAVTASSAVADTVPLALCLAIEKLIDGGGNEAIVT